MENVTAAANIPIFTAKTAHCTMQYFRFGTGEKTMVILPGLAVQSVMGSAQAVAEATGLGQGADDEAPAEAETEEV